MRYPAGRASSRRRREFHKIRHTSVVGIRMRTPNENFSDPQGGS
jgi:hypothetical protein